MSTIKVKQSGGGSEYLETIPSIQLNQGFQQSLQNAVNKINENFKKLISLPFLQGDHGNSIFETTINIGEGELGERLKTAICQSIYGSDSPDDSSFGGNHFGNSWQDTSSGQTYDGTQIVFYRHKETSEQSDKFFYTAREFFLFIDRRVENLRSANLGSASLMSAITSFTDLSCALTIFADANADPETGQPDPDSITFEVKKHSIVPTLYYDSVSMYWCWAVNGVKTGVIAQGVKGDAGNSRSIYVCKGIKGSVPSKQETNTILKITDVMQPEEFKNCTQLQFAEHVNTGDLLVVWFKDETSKDSVWSSLDNCTFGTAKKHITYNNLGQAVDGYAYIDNGTTAGNRLDLATIMAETSLYRWLNDICNNEAVLNGPTINPAIRGLYIPNGVPFEGNKVHMLWSDFGTGDSPIASIGCVTSDARQLNGGASLPSWSGDSVSNWNTSDKSTLNIWYPTLRCHRGTFYRLMKDYAMVSGVKPANLADQGLKNYCDPGINPSSLSLARQSGEIASAVSLRGPESDAVKDETVIASSGLYIKRNIDSSNPNDVPSVYIDNGIHGKIYVKGGRITTENSRILIGRKDGKWADPKTYFSAKYDGSNPAESDGGSYTSSVEDSIRTNRWDFSITNDGDPNYMDNPGVKLVSSDIVSHGGMIIVSSDNAYKNVFIKDNKLMFDYKVHAEIGTASQGSLDNSTAVHDRRPRYKEYIGIQIGGYNTIYNSITSNGSAGKVNTVLDNTRDPISLTPEQNKEYALLSGKSGYTAMIENWGADGVRAMDPSYTLDGNTTIRKEDGNWGLVTSYNCLWTKIGNVVDVKGKIFINKAKYTTDGSTISVNTTSAKPVSYAELFRHIKRYGTAWAFPLPVVVNSGTKTSPVYKVSTGNMLDNPSENEKIVNSPMLGDGGSGWYPKLGAISARKYHNDIFNGSAQFHFYGTTKEFTTYSATVDSYGTNPAALDGGMFMAENVDVLNNVFTVTADISKSPTYDNRYWCMSGIPNYDVLNFRGPINNADFARLDQFRMTEGSLGPVKIVSHEDGGNNITNRRDGEITDPVSPTVNARYRQSHAILGICNIPSQSTNSTGDDSSWDGRRPTHFKEKAGKLDIAYNNFPNTLEAEHLGIYLKQNFMQNLRSYKVSVNIGPYMVRYISFAFSYLLDDDVQEAYQGTDRAGRIASADQDQWVIPTGVDRHKVSGWEEKNVSAEVPAYDDDDK